MEAKGTAPAFALALWETTKTLAEQPTSGSYADSVIFVNVSCQNGHNWSGPLDGLDSLLTVWTMLSFSSFRRAFASLSPANVRPYRPPFIVVIRLHLNA